MKAHLHTLRSVPIPQEVGADYRFDVYFCASVSIFPYISHCAVVHRCLATESIMTRGLKQLNLTGG